MSTLANLMDHACVIGCVSAVLCLLPISYIFYAWTPQIRAYVLHFILWKFNLPVFVVQVVYYSLQAVTFGLLVHLRMNKSWPMPSFLFAGAAGMILFMKVRFLWCGFILWPFNQFFLGALIFQFYFRIPERLIFQKAIVGCRI